MNRGIFRGELDGDQRAIFAQILNGKTGRQIAADLGVTSARVEGIVRKTCRQLDAPNRRDAARMIGSHYGWISNHPIPFARVDHRYGHHDGAGDQFPAAKTVPTEREQYRRSGYDRDVGNQVLDKDEVTDVYSEVAGRSSISKLVAASSTTQRVLLIALLIASSTLALSALVSAMQGFDVLMFS